MTTWMLTQDTETFFGPIAESDGRDMATKIYVIGRTVDGTNFQVTAERRDLSGLLLEKVYRPVVAMSEAEAQAIADDLIQYTSEPAQTLYFTLILKSRLRNSAGRAAAPAEDMSLNDTVEWLRPQPVITSVFTIFDIQPSYDGKLLHVLAATVDPLRRELLELQLS
jgi:hypothetical protein